MKSSLTCSIINRAWIESMRPGYMKFRKAINEPEAVQADYLQRLLKNNRNTEFGRVNDFRNIHSVKQFQQKVPLSIYGDYEPYIDMIAKGQNNILTADTVRVFEPSSGSTSASKFIPYTKSLRQDFNRGIAPWMFSLYKANPGLFKGKAYWSISPAMDQQKYKGTVKVGFEDDSDYLGFLGKHFYNKIAAVPMAIAKESNIDTFRNKTLAHLLFSRNLALISVWNPTFLTLLLEHLLQNMQEVLRAVKEICGNKRPHRAKEIEKSLSSIDKASDFQSIWPNLAVISCWTDGACSLYADQLYDYFPDTSIQGKGLIATEGFVSLPIDGCDFPVLAMNSHFFEFKDMDNDDIRLAQELEIGKRYSVIISTGGGLYRYQLKDIIEVTGFAGQTPMFKFISKEDGTVDYFGEKLDESHVISCIQSVCKEVKLEPSFFLLAPLKNPEGSISYAIFMESNLLSPDFAKKILEKLEDGLRENYHYNYCRKLGQIANLRLFSISSGGKECYSQRICNNGVKLGDIKPVSLSSMTGWEKHFIGKFADKKTPD